MRHCYVNSYSGPNNDGGSSCLLYLLSICILLRASTFVQHVVARARLRAVQGDVR
jgi:hypothetical protein